MNMTLYKLLILCLIAESCSQSLIPDYDGCSKQYDDITDIVKCTHTLYCRNHVSNFDLTRHPECYNQVDYYGNGDYHDPVTIVLEHDENYETIPKFSSSNYWEFVYSLDLSDNNYRAVPDLKPMRNLAVLRISRCGLSTARMSNINDLPDLIDLDYSQNTIDDIKVIPGEYEYKTLKKLNISHNYLVNIPEAIFDSFPNIESLDLSHNFLDVLDILSFEGIRKLLHLYLSNNRIINLDSSLLRLRYLVTLDLAHNSIHTLKASDYGKLLNLQEIKLDSNEIKAIEKNAFDNMASLTTVDLRNNMLESIDQDIFSNTTKLISVYLSRNKMKVIPKNMFKGRRIFNFDVAGNALEGALERGSFEGLTMVTELDLSGQHLSSVENYAFAGLASLKTLLLNNNDVRSLSNFSLKGLNNLICLDLSHNKIDKMDIATEDLISLEILSLNHNYIAHISNDNFAVLGSLQFLDLSHNNLSHLGSNSFRSLRSLLSFKISDNPLCGSIEENTFDGLRSLPSLDVSGTLITSINNGSFTGMTLLRDLNVSHSNITELQYNALSYMSNIQTIDLSFNQLSTFDINTTDFGYLKTLMLNNNMLQVISQTLFKGMNLLTTIDLSNNHIHTIHKEAFYALEDIRKLDLSYNAELLFGATLVEKAQNLAKLLLSGTKSEVTFDRIGEIPLTRLEVAHSGIQNISRLNLCKLQRLETLVVSNNAVSKLEVGALSNLTTLKLLDLSYNNLSYIQPGVFKDNTYLNLLNVSHNKLVEINYGIFRGLAYLEVMDLSYNKIKSLHRARFYDVEHLSTLIVDYNEIDFISEEEFVGTSLSKLSIGSNPLPCEILASMDKNSFSLSISAINIDETNENVKGVTCNKGNQDFHSKLTPTTAEHDKLLLDIRNILYNTSKNNAITHNDSTYTLNLTEQQLILSQKLSSVSNLTFALVNLNNNTNIILQKLNQNSINSIDKMTSTLVNVSNNTNLLLEKLLHELTSKDAIVMPTSNNVTIAKVNATAENVIPFINKIKQQLEQTIAIEKQNIILDLDKKIEKINSRIESSILTTKPSVHEKLVGNSENTQKSLMFTEVCVGLILVILVGFILFKVYKSKLYVPSGRSFSSSTRNIAESMESSHL